MRSLGLFNANEKLNFTFEEIQLRPIPIGGKVDKHLMTIALMESNLSTYVPEILIKNGTFQNTDDVIDVTCLCLLIDAFFVMFFHTKYLFWF